MANWCFNTIKTDSEQIHGLFHRLMKKADREKCGVLYKWMGDDRYFFDIHIEDQLIMFNTKWAPPDVAISNIAKRYNVGITMGYDEPGMAFYGTLYVSKDDGRFDDYHNGVRMSLERF